MATAKKKKAETPEEPQSKEQLLKESEKRFRKFPTLKIALDADQFMFLTNDINVAAYLKIIGTEIVDIRKKSEKELDMWFKCPDQEQPWTIAQDVTDYVNNRGQSGRYQDFINARGDLISYLKHFK